MIFNVRNLFPALLEKIEKSNSLLIKYFSTTELLWQEGFYIDFLQKKITDSWIKKFLVVSSYLFNEKLVFEALIKFFMDQILIPFHKFSIFEFNSLANVLFATMFSLVLFYFIYFYAYLWFLFF